MGLCKPMFSPRVASDDNISCFRENSVKVRSKCSVFLGFMSYVNPCYRPESHPMICVNRESPLKCSIIRANRVNVFSKYFDVSSGEVCPVHSRQLRRKPKPDNPYFCRRHSYPNEMVLF